MRISAWEKDGRRIVYFNFKDGNVRIVPQRDTGREGWAMLGGEGWMITEVERWLSHNFGGEQDFDRLFARAKEIADYYKAQREAKKCQS